MVLEVDAESVDDAGGETPVGDDVDDVEEVDVGEADPSEQPCVLFGHLARNQAQLDREGQQRPLAKAEVGGVPVFDEGPNDVGRLPGAQRLAEVLEDYRPGKNLKVAWDAGNGAAGEAMAALAAGLPGEHILLNAEIDGRFPNHHPDPTVPENLVQLAEAVTSQGCDLGIVNRAVPPEELEAAAAELGRRLAGLPTVAVGYMKKNLNAAIRGASLGEVLDLESLHMTRAMMTEDHKAASRAFVEKRAPVFKGR